MSFEEQTPGFTPQQRLATFIWAVYQDLNSVVALRYELFAGPIYRDFLNALERAWEEVYRQRVDVFGEALHSDLDTLNAVGLSGSQLIAKLEAWHGSRERLLDEFEVGGPEPPTSSPEVPPFGPRWLLRNLRRRRPLHRKRALKWLARVLAHADNILGSLVPVIKLAEPLKELKHAIDPVSSVSPLGRARNHP